MGEVLARVNKTSIYGVGLGEAESRREEQRPCVFPWWHSHSPLCSPLLPHFLHSDTMMVLCTLTPSRFSLRHTFCMRKLMSYVRWRAVGAFHFSIPSIQHHVCIWQAPNKCAWLELSHRQEEDQAGLCSIRGQWGTMETVRAEEQCDAAAAAFQVSLVALGSLVGHRREGKACSCPCRACQLVCAGPALGATSLLLAMRSWSH